MKTLVRSALWLSVVCIIGLVGGTALAQDGGERDQGIPTPGNRLFFDDFATFVNQWSRDTDAAAEITYTEQTLRFTLSEGDTLALSQPENIRPFENFFMETSLTFTADSAPDSIAGLVFGYQNTDNYYVFGLQPSGHYQVYLRLDGEWWPTPLVRGYAPDVAAAPDELHQLQLIYDAGLYVLRIDGQTVVPFYSDTLDAGTFGLYAQTVGGPATVAFDDFAVYDLVYEEPEPADEDMTDEAAPDGDDVDSDTDETDDADDVDDADDTGEDDADLDDPDDDPDTDDPTLPRI